MILIPAIDLMGGRPVRLAQGAREHSTHYDVEPSEVVTRFVAAGAERIHIVDLDGAFAGPSNNRDALLALIEQAHRLGAGVQVGGGIRTAEHAATLVEHGADFVVIGTLAVREPDEAAAVCTAYPGRIIVAADARDGKVAIEGWQQATAVEVTELAGRAQSWGAAAVLYTDVARDGMGTGPAVEATVQVQAAVEIPVYASGGVGSLVDIEACARAGIAGIVVGRAIYEGAIDLKEALSRC